MPTFDTNLQIRDDVDDSTTSTGRITFMYLKKLYIDDVSRSIDL